MRVVRATVWLTFPLMLGAMWVALSGGFGAHSEIPIVLTATSAIVAVSPASRRAGLISVLLWSLMASGGFALNKYAGPLGFAAFGALSIAAAATYSVRCAQWLLYPLAYIEAVWIGSLAHQTAFEIATVGHPTLTIDSCTTALMPLLFGFLLAAAGIVSGLLTVLLPELRNALQYKTQLPDPLNVRSARIALAAGIAVGATFGFVPWHHDWQINQPCL